jgi:multidrug efflux pump subunit AcrA (membrane-fusion protein)
MVNFARRLFYFAGLALVAGTPIPAVAQPAPAVPVTVTTASKQDVPIWLRGLGTVQAYYAVQLRPRVDGTLMQVPVTEGRMSSKALCWR